MARAQILLLDLIGVASVGATTGAGRVAARVASRHLRGIESVPILFQGASCGVPGAAMAGAFAIDSIDAHDGDRLAKGHAGCAAMPAALAFTKEGSGEEFLTRLVLGYEIGCRAGVALHASAADYHTSGAWIALAVAAIGARALQLSCVATREALGIGEYHGPRSPMMRCIDHPTMVKDGSGWGALSGATAALLAAEGFTGAPAMLVEDPALSRFWSDFGNRWLILEQYVKPEPVCRWAQPAVHAAIALRLRHAIDPAAVARIEVRTFAEAARLACARPRTTEEAQYALPYPVGVALAKGAVGPADVLRLDDGPSLALSGKVAMRVDEGYSAAFPQRRLADVTVVLTDGTRLESGPTEADGDPERPLSDDAIRAKFRSYAAPVLGARRAGLIEALVDGLPADDIAPLAAALSAPPSAGEDLTSATLVTSERANAAP